MVPGGAIVEHHAAGFLHNQLSQDVQHLGDGQARLAAYCSAKGRMLASLLLLYSSASYYRISLASGVPLEDGRLHLLWMGLFAVLAGYGITAQARADAPGVYVDRLFVGTFEKRIEQRTVRQHADA